MRYTGKNKKTPQTPEQYKIKKGKIICQGRPLDVINKENLKEIYGIDANLTISEDGQYPICMEYDLFRGKNEK